MHMRGDVNKPRRRQARRKKPESEKGGKKFRSEEEGRRKRSFSRMRLYGVDEQQPASPPLPRRRESLLAKARRLAFPVDATGKYKKQSVCKLYARDISAAGCTGLPALHKRGLHIVLNELLHRQWWPQVAGVLSVLLRALFAEPSWSPHYSQYFWAAMEVTRQQEGLQGNDWKIKKMFQLLMEKQPRDAWSHYKVEAGAISLELALFLLSQKQYELAKMQSERCVACPPYRGHAMANLVHGLIHYYEWFDLTKRDLEQEMKKEPVVDLSEGVGENETFFGAKQSISAEDLREGPIIRLDDDFPSNDISTFEGVENERKGYIPFQELKGSVPHAIREISWNMHDDTEEDTEKSYMDKARVLYNRELDERLFPFRLPRQYWGKDYKIVAKSVLHNKSHGSAIKHLQEALSLESSASTALLPLLQLLLADADIKGAYLEIEKSCQKFSDHNSFRTRCLFLESLTHTDKALLIGAYEELLKMDPLSTHTVEKLVEIHKAGNYSTGRLLQQIGLHLDASSGSILAWKRLALCFQSMKEDNAQRVKIIMDTDLKATGQDSCYTNFCWEPSAQEEWKVRKKWWLIKHFQENTVGDELNTNGCEWLMFKAASAAHIYGASMQYVLKIERKLEEFGSYSSLAELHLHKQHSFNLLSFLEKLDHDNAC